VQSWDLITTDFNNCISCLFSHPVNQSFFCSCSTVWNLLSFEEENKSWKSLNFILRFSFRVCVTINFSDSNWRILAFKFSCNFIINWS
jgi:hypothetical protein